MKANQESIKRRVKEDKSGAILTYHRVLGANVVENKCSEDSTWHIEQAEDVREETGAVIKTLDAYKMTVFQPRITVREVSPPVMLFKE